MAKTSLPDKSKKTRLRATRFDLSQDKLIRDRAKAAGKSVSAYIREKALA